MPSNLYEYVARRYDVEIHERNRLRREGRQMSAQTAHDRAQAYKDVLDFLKGKKAIAGKAKLPRSNTVDDLFDR